MSKTFTLSDLMRYIYRETTPDESAELLEAMNNDEELRSEYHDLLRMQEELGEELIPETKCIDHIFGYARAVSILNTKDLGNIELILN